MGINFHARDYDISYENFIQKGHTGFGNGYGGHGVGMRGISVL